MKRFELLLTQTTAKAWGKTLSWLLIYYTARGWKLVTVYHTPKGKAYRIIK